MATVKVRSLRDSGIGFGNVPLFIRTYSLRFRSLALSCVNEGLHLVLRWDLAGKPR